MVCDATILEGRVESTSIAAFNLLEPIHIFYSIFFNIKKALNYKLCLYNGNLYDYIFILHK